MPVLNVEMDERLMRALSAKAGAEGRLKRDIVAEALEKHCFRYLDLDKGEKIVCPPHERLNEDGICRACGQDVRGFVG